MRKIREILRLKEEAGLSNRAIARASKISNSTVEEYLRRAEAANLHWPLPEGISEEELYRKLFPEDAPTDEPERPLPDCEYIKKELKKKGVTLTLLWEEHKDKHPDHPYQYTQFCEYYRRWAKTQTPSARFPHNGREVIEVDYVGLTMTLVNPENGATTQVPDFSPPCLQATTSTPRYSPVRKNATGSVAMCALSSFSEGSAKFCVPTTPKWG